MLGRPATWSQQRTAEFKDLATRLRAAFKAAAASGEFTGACASIDAPPMFTRLEEDMDINCGLVIDGTLTIEQMGQQIFEHILRTASGEATKSEALNLGDSEFVPWHLGIVS